MFRPRAIALLTVLSGLAGVGRAQPVTSASVGAVELTIKGGSDTVLAVPLAQRPVYTGRVLLPLSRPGEAPFVFRVPGSPGWVTDQFAGTHYVRFTSGAREGMYYTVVANSATQLTIDPAGDSLQAVAAGDTFQLVPHWTLASLFPPAMAGSAANPLTASLDFTPTGRRSEVLLPDQATAGINLPPADRYFFTDGGWVAATAGNPDANATVLAPDTFFIVRQPPAVSGDATWLATGDVVTTRLAIPLATQSGGGQDNFVALIRPVDVRLADSGLETGFVESPGRAGFQRRDTLLVFDNAVAGYNQSATRAYFRVAGTWYSDARGNPVANEDLLKAGSGFIIRKSSHPQGITFRWTNSPGY